MGNNKWPTKNKDMQIAHVIMEEYADENNSSLGLFELFVDEKAKQMNFRLANWVRVLNVQFTSMYGQNHGDYVTRRVLSDCIRHGNTIH